MNHRKHRADLSRFKVAAIVPQQRQISARGIPAKTGTSRQNIHVAVAIIVGHRQKTSPVHLQNAPGRHQHSRHVLMKAHPGRTHRSNQIHVAVLIMVDPCHRRTHRPE